MNPLQPSHDSSCAYKSAYEHSVVWGDYYYFACKSFEVRSHSASSLLSILYLYIYNIWLHMPNGANNHSYVFVLCTSTSAERQAMHACMAWCVVCLKRCYKSILSRGQTGHAHHRTNGANIMQKWQIFHSKLQCRRMLAVVSIHSCLYLSNAKRMCARTHILIYLHRLLVICTWFWWVMAARKEQSPYSYIQYVYAYMGIS